MTHTPGPWEVRQAETGHIAVYPMGGRERIADLYCPLDKPGNQNANASIIAAAPEMLKALESGVRQLHAGVDPLQVAQQLEAMARHAKAEGHNN